jgi:coenzyme F420-0:L-glutamate ligase/coenzyme F420-1:gamma-L-glutamate ligase
MPLTVEPIAVPGEIPAGADLGALLAAAAPPLQHGDVVVVTHKAVAKAEGRTVRLADVEPSPFARTLAGPDGDARHVEVVLRQSRRIVRTRGSLVIAETAHGFVCANAGVDRSNAPEQDSVVLLPEEPDISATWLRAALERRSGARVAVVVSDTFGRAWRVGLVGVAIGVSGLRPLLDLRGGRDATGYELQATTIAAADALAAVGDLVMGKTAGTPAALVRGYGADGEGTAAELVRDPGDDLFR